MVVLIKSGGILILRIDNNGCPSDLLRIHAPLQRIDQQPVYV